jgi:hypothetical protein
MKIDVQFGDEYTAMPNGAMCQYRNGKCRLLGGSCWVDDGSQPNERTIRYSLSSARWPRPPVTRSSSREEGAQP